MDIPVSLSYRNAARYARSRKLYSNALELIPGGVNSTARAVWSGWDPHPIFAARGAGARIWDADDNVYIDYLLGLGPMLLGHCPPKITAAVVDFIQSHGTVFALPHSSEIDVARKITAAVPSVEQVRLCNTGTEAVLYAVRLARAFTGRPKLIRFEGMYHGFSDGVYWSKHPPLRAAGADDCPIPVPQGPGMPEGIEDSLLILPWNDIALFRDAIEHHGSEIAAVITEPVMCNTGCILPEAGYLEQMRELTTKHGILLIFDEVITGFRLSLAGAQGLFNIKPDLSVFAKGLGGGYPVAALGGRADIMALVGNGTVSVAGTYSANGIAVAATSAALDELSQPGMYERLFAVSDRLRHGLEEALIEADTPTRVVGVGPVLQVWFSEQPIRNYRDAARFARHDLFRLWWEGMLDRGVLFHPGAYENLFVSFAHNQQDIDETLIAARETARTLRRHQLR
jgi:glutamate-1-semialdehyde 2,1-aminomutase